jgi:hypothetical protein
VNSRANERFWEAFQRLPAQVQRSARRAYRTFRINPFHPSLQFKQVHPRRPIFSARVGLGYRALGIRDGEDIVWFWVGTHGEYDRLVSWLRRG